jgi:regulatory protein spx
MIKVYTSASCSSCRKAVAWMNRQGLPFQEINVFQNKLTLEEVRDMFRLTELGTDDIVSKRAKVLKTLEIDVEDMSLQALFQLVIDQPTLLKRPVIVDGKRVATGFHDEEIRQFIPRQQRKRLQDRLSM